MIIRELTGDHEHAADQLTDKEKTLMRSGKLMIVTHQGKTLLMRTPPLNFSFQPMRRTLKQEEKQP